jgi:hypothetical protein
MLHEAQRTSAPERLQRLDQDRRLDGHVQRAGDARALEGLLLAVLLAQAPSGPAFPLSAKSISLRPKAARLDVLDEVIRFASGILFLCHVTFLFLG